MKIIKGNPGRDSCADTIYKCGDFTYRLDLHWAKLPGGMSSISISGGCCDKDDNLYLVTRSLDHPIIILDKDGNYVRSLGHMMFNLIHSAFVTKKNTLLCADAGHHIIRELDIETGEIVRDLGNYCKPSDSGYDGGLWLQKVREGELPMNVLQYSQTMWSFATNMTTIKRAAPPFNRPTAAVVSSKGYIYCSDGYGNAAIHKFNSDGDLLKTWGGPGREPGKFVIVHSLWVDNLDRIWAVDREGSAVHVFDEDGNILMYCGENLYQPTDLWADDKYMYVGERGGFTIFDMDFEIKAQLGYYQSPIQGHGLCGNSGSDIFDFTLTSSSPYNILKFIRI